MLYDQMQAEHARLTRRISSLENEIARMPEGDLGWQRRGEKYRYYCQTDKRQYLSKTKDRSLIEDLAKKKYLEKMLSDDKNECAAIERYLKGHRDPALAQKLLTENPHVAEILNPLFRSTKEELNAWAAADYPSTAAYPEQLIFPGPMGKMFRSKSEAQIAFHLYSNALPYRYEWDRQICGKIYHIDFTIRHPETGKLIFWEHCGLMDKDGYAANIGTKIREFETAGIFPGRNLILTFESKRFPFTTGMAEEIIQKEILKK